MTDELITFVRARLDEDEELARQAAEAGPLAQWDSSIDVLLASSLRMRRRLADQGVPLALDGAAMAHTARHDPDRVLREVEAKRGILRWHSTPHTVVDGFCTDEGGPCTHRGEAECTLCGGTACATLRLLALPHAGHPDYREDWRP